MIFDFFKTEKRAEMTEEALLSSLTDTTTITKDNVLNIPAVAGAVELISSTFAMIPIRLYKDNVLCEDKRNTMLNKECGDTLTSYDVKLSMCRDYLINGNGYAYIKKSKGTFDSLYYVDSGEVSVMEGTDPIFKDNVFSVRGITYKDFDFLKLIRHTKNGATGYGILTENKEQLALMYSLIGFEEKMIARGGIKSGFLQSENQLTQNAMDALKAAWKQLFTSKGESAIVLNNGVKFNEASSTATEMELNTSKRLNSEEVAKMLNIPKDMLSGTVNDSVYRQFIKQTIMPICMEFEKELNKNLLLENEKEHYKFEFDYSEIIKGDVKNRYEAYGTAIKNGIMTINEVREKENIAQIDGLNILSLNLGSVVYDTEKEIYYTPNTNQVVNLNQVENNEVKENGNENGN